MFEWFIKKVKNPVVSSKEVQIEKLTEWVKLDIELKDTKKERKEFISDAKKIAKDKVCKILFKNSGKLYIFKFSNYFHHMFGKTDRDSYTIEAFENNTDDLIENYNLTKKNKLVLSKMVDLKIKISILNTDYENAKDAAKAVYTCPVVVVLNDKNYLVENRYDDVISSVWLKYSEIKNAGEIKS